MQDILSVYAETQPDKPGVIDDKGNGNVVVWTYAELEARSTGWRTCCCRSGQDPAGR